MNKNFKVQAQGGFTLIELIVVIVILGILAATALPKFANLSGDARFANITAAKGALASASSLVHAQALVKNAIPAKTVKMEGTDIAMTTAGYPTTVSILTAAGIDTTNDYKAYTAAAAATATTPLVPADSVVLVPKGIVDTATATKCYVTYTTADNSTAAPVITATGSVDNCQ